MTAANPASLAWRAARACPRVEMSRVMTAAPTSRRGPPGPPPRTLEGAAGGGRPRRDGQKDGQRALILRRAHGKCAPRNEEQPGGENGPQGGGEQAGAEAPVPGGNQDGQDDGGEGV